MTTPALKRGTRQTLGGRFSNDAATRFMVQPTAVFPRVATSQCALPWGGSGAARARRPDQCGGYTSEISISWLVAGSRITEPETTANSATKKRGTRQTLGRRFNKGSSSRLYGTTHCLAGRLSPASPSACPRGGAGAARAGRPDQWRSGEIFSRTGTTP